MKMKDAMAIINHDPNKGYMVSFELVDGYLLRSDNFPDKHAGEELIPTESEAWELAFKFAMKMKGKAVNVYVVNSDFQPVPGYRENMWNRLPSTISS